MVNMDYDGVEPREELPIAFIYTVLIPVSYLLNSQLQAMPKQITWQSKQLIQVF